MRRYALINNNLVTNIVDIEDDDLLQYTSLNNMVIDVQDEIPEIQIGYILSGNKLVPPSTAYKAQTTDLYQQTAQRLFGLKILPELIDEVGARNLKLDRDRTPIDVISLATQMSSIKLLLEGGALKTVRGICASIKPMYPHHADILDKAINKITAFLLENNWD